MDCKTCHKTEELCHCVTCEIEDCPHRIGAPLHTVTTGGWYCARGGVLFVRWDARLNTHARGWCDAHLPLEYTDPEAAQRRDDADYEAYRQQRLNPQETS